MINTDEQNPQLNAEFIYTLVKNIENLSNALEKIQEKETDYRVETIDRINTVKDELKDIISKKTAEAIVCTSSVKTDTATMRSDIRTLKTDMAIVKKDLKAVGNESIMTSTKIKVYIAIGSLIGGGIVSSVFLIIAKIAVRQIAVVP